jgi:hypothetical protein
MKLGFIPNTAKKINEVFKLELYYRNKKCYGKSGPRASEEVTGDMKRYEILKLKKNDSLKVHIQVWGKKKHKMTIHA